MGTLQVVVGGQFGSEGKGAVCGALAAGADWPLGMVRVGGPNAGHTVWDHEDRIWKLRHVPVAAVANRGAKLLLGPGSEIDADVLAQEVRELESAGYNVADRLIVDQSATLMTPEDQDREAEMGLIERIGSTGKGIGAARAARIWRMADVFGGNGDVRSEIERILATNGTVIVEGTQGYGLGLHTNYYPQCTSSDCDAGSMMAMAGVVPWSPFIKRFEVWVVFRTLPIRVAGNSGPLVEETTWSELGLPAEHTTVTKKVRRVGLWDQDLAARALRANGGPGRNVRIVITGLDLLFRELEEKRGKWGHIEDLQEGGDAWAWLMEREEELGQEVDAVRIGPGQGDILWR